MRVIISAGGTGGHIYPALALVDKIKQKEPNSEFLYIGTHNRMEKDIVPKYGIPFKTIEMYGFNRKKLWKNFKTFYCLYKGKKICKKTIKEFKPDIVIGFGGYITAPVIMAANSLGIKTFIHEQNSVVGKANLALARYTSLVAVSFKSTMNSFKNNKVIYTGNPVSESAVAAKPALKKEFGLHDNKKLVLIVMGSLGAHLVNEYLKEELMLFNSDKYEVVFVTGKQDYDEINKINFPKNVKVFPYIENLARIMKKTDVMVTRAGASTLSELEALQIPSILIPSPYVPNNHQLKNAMDLVNNKAAKLLEEKDLQKGSLLKEVEDLLNNSKEMIEMKQNLDKLCVKNSSDIMYDSIKNLLGEE